MHCMLLNITVYESYNHTFSGVGKTSLVNLICHNESLPSPAWTIGCSVETKVTKPILLT